MVEKKDIRARIQIIQNSLNAALCQLIGGNLYYIPNIMARISTQAQLAGIDSILLKNQ